MLPFIIAGLTTGSVYGLAAVGLVLTYKTSGVFNFAHGALATVAAYLFYELHVQHSVDWKVAGFICVFVVGPMLGLVFELIARRLADRSLATRVVSTVGVLLIVQSVVTLVYGTAATRIVPEFLPQKSFDVGGTNVSSAQIIVFAVGVVATSALYVFFRRARLGVAMRAVVDDPELLATAGTSPTLVRRWSWVIGVTFASASGVLLISIPPPQPLNPLTLTFLVVAAFGAAALGGFTSLPITYVGGLAIGVAAALSSKYLTSGIWAGLSVSMPFLVLFAVLLFTPRRRLTDRARVIPSQASSWSMPWRIQAVFGAGLLVLLVMVPNLVFVGFHLPDYTEGIALVILFLSLGLLTRTSGQVSLAHVSFMAIGVCAFAQFNTVHHWPWALALIAAGLVAVPIGALLAIPAIRLSGLYLALATFGFGILLQYMFYTQSYMFGDLGLGVQIKRPVLSFLAIDTDKGYYYLVLMIAVLCSVAVIAVNRSRLGRLLRGLSDSPVGLAANGVSINVTRVLVFCISAFLAAIAGVLAAGAFAAGGTAYVGGDNYQPLQSLIFFTLIIIAVGGAPWYAVLAGLVTTLIPSYFPGADTATWLALVFGVTAVLYSVAPARYLTLSAGIRQTLDRVGRRKAASTTQPVDVDHQVPKAARLQSGGLKVSNLTVAFGGHVAVDNVSIEAPVGRVTGLMGPNGAGKSTTINACSGLIRPTSGTITLENTAVTNLGSANRARRGLGRTFQHMELFDSLTTRENIELGAEGVHAGKNAFAHLVSTPKQKAKMRAVADEALRLCDLIEYADTPVGTLSTGQRRLVELARCLAGEYQVMLLDEPSSGLDRAETARFGEILKQVVAERGTGVLLVEHDMALVADVCEYIYVLDFGEPIFEGPTQVVMSSPIVQSAYLGTADVEVAAETKSAEQEVIS